MKSNFAVDGRTHAEYQDQIGNAGLACGAEDYAGKPERGRAEKEQLHEQEVRQEEENRQSSR